MFHNVGDVDGEALDRRLELDEDTRADQRQQRQCGIFSGGLSALHSANLRTDEQHACNARSQHGAGLVTTKGVGDRYRLPQAARPAP